ncbi:glutamate-5-semialdehyde dehydrogenase [Candidatus Formimonas warabiya]|uniref:Gamma-glutamyl phosphate reductase n=1 Tax=Formimonas warabiya TaxID=1761012 RepID=A0A3G1KSR3_FORW1|nr:glutamate-5-semialdehyde dehydrogenase [Candidatus Formimonas warabiya]ATW25470.1 glutamate-5-semialdehyde dehydrogenase [Candidatus Formimonas warabiya]
MELKDQMREIGAKARKAARKLSTLSSAQKDHGLKMIAEALIHHSSLILDANQKDLKEGRQKGLPEALMDRLLLNEMRIEEMAQGMRALAALPDPVGEVTGMWKRPNGLMIGKKRVPLGVVGIIYEARPNVTADAAGLCLKTGNAAVLRGGSEAFYSNLAISEVISQAAEEAGMPVGCIQLVRSTDRSAVDELLKMNQYLDVVIPRGGAGLIQHVVNHATVPVIETGVGNCHTYIDSEADMDMALDIAINAKTSRPGVCNAMETLLVNREIAPQILPLLGEKFRAKGVELRGCPQTCRILPEAVPAKEEDWSTEYLDLILAVKVVDDLDAAIEHISLYGTKHSEAIVTNNYGKAQRFLEEVDAAAVYVNASTRFTDGGQFGYGAEIGISTQKLHARGPMGLEALTTIKYIIYGNGQIRN